MPDKPTRQESLLDLFMAAAVLVLLIGVLWPNLTRHSALVRENAVQNLRAFTASVEMYPSPAQPPAR